MGRYSISDVDDITEPLPATYQHRDSSVFIREIIRKKVKDADDNLMGFLDTIRDVSPITMGENRFRTFLQSAPMGIIIVREDGCISFVNTVATKLFGHDREEIVGETIEMLLPDRYHMAHVQYRADYHENPHFRPMGIGLDLIGRHKDGQELLVEVSLNAVEIDGETMTICFIVDISRQRQVEEALRESEELLKSTISSMDDVVFILDKYGVFLAYDHEFRHGLDVPSQELWGRSYREVLPNPVAERLEAAIKAVQETGKVQQFDYSLGPDERVVWFNAKASARTDKCGEFDGVTIISRDVTERKLVEMELAKHTAELEAQNAELDAFAHTVAHDLKTPVALILGHADMLQKYSDLATDSLVLESLNQIIITGQRLDNIISELLLLASVRKREVEMGPLNMFAIVEQAQKRLAFMSKQYRAEFTLPYSWPVAMGYGPWIEEVWANYLSNAIKHGGRPPRIELGFTVQPDGMVRYWIKDNGAGILPEDQARIFTPFAQLGQIRARGHGLGLSIVRRIIDKCGGQVGVESEMDVGSTFWFLLPAASEQ
jgi:PAS domain S-box-containing protein